MEFSKVKKQSVKQKKTNVQNNSNNNGNNMSMHEFNYCNEPKSMTFQLIFVEDIYHPRHARVGPKLKYAFLNS